MFDYVRIAAAVGDLIVGDTVHNTQDIITKMHTASENKADITVFPELAITGYTCGDLFFQAELINGALKGLKEILAESKNLFGIFAVGLPLIIRGQLYNCAVIVKGGKIWGITPKSFIPVYNEFYEKRWFSSAEDLTEKSILSSELGFAENYEIPVGTDIIFKTDGFTFGAEICEDLWAPVSPSSFLALSGAEIILNLSASNETIMKAEYRASLVSQQSAKCICTYAYVSAGENESTSDLVFSGKSIIAENGTVIKENDSFITSDYLMFCDTDLGKLRADRMKIKTFKDCARMTAADKSIRTVYIDANESESAGELYYVSKLPFIPSDKNKRIKRCNEIFEMQVTGLKKRITVTGGRPVLGISGGLDSTLALLVCVRAMNRLGKKQKEIVAVTMPGFGTTGRTYQNAVKLMETLGVTMREVSIKEACLLHFSDIGHDPRVHDVTYENVQARERTQILMDIANKIGGFVVGTGDLSELALGWCTYNADHMSMYGVNSGVPKTLVRWLIDSAVESGMFEKSAEILKDILDTPISPELLPPDENGKIAQKTEDLVGPYSLHDFFLYYVLRFGFSPEKIYYMAKKAFSDDFTDDVILKWEKNFYRRFFTQQFKRNCLPDGVKVGSVCLSPRGDWRMPSDASARIWLNALENM